MGKRIETLVIFAVMLSIILISPASAQTITALGEVRTSGKVFIESSDGKWLPAPAVYPLLQGSAIKAEEGSASIFFRDGSRMDLSKDTVTSVNGSVGNMVISLAQGTVAFNVPPTAAFTVTTPSASVAVNSPKGMVQKVTFEKPVRVLGTVTAGEKGTEVRSISGRMIVTVSRSEARVLASGESMFIGPDSAQRVYKTQSVGGAAGLTSGQKVAVTAISGVFVATTTILSFDVWRGSGRRIASNATP